MKYKELGTTGLKISELCLGSMTWGTQNTTEEGHQQIDMALDHGVNIIDTAEMYPVNPLTKDTQGETERVIGKWVAKSGKRDKVLLATKVSGAGYANVRDGAPISAITIQEALNNSLKSLQTDYVDVYQLHWPNRGSYMFRQNWSYDPTGQDRDETIAHMHEVLETLQELKKAGKIRHFGLSNESAWGTTKWVQIAAEQNLPKVQSIQNEYSLLCRLFDTDLAEVCHNEQIGLLSFSPLATGLLTGKYHGGSVVPKGSRMSHVPNLGGRITPRVWNAIAAYEKIALDHGLNIAQMALAWCNSRPFMASSIFGATSMEQLKLALGSTDIELANEVMSDISTAHKAHPMPY